MSKQTLSRPSGGKRIAPSGKRKDVPSGKKKLAPSGKALAVRYAVFVLASVLLQALPLAYELFPVAAQGLYLVHGYVLTPLYSLCGAFLCGKWGIHPYLAFFPPEMCFLLSPLYDLPAVGLIALLISFFAAVAGAEWKKRSEGRT